MTDFETPTYHQLESRLAATQSELAELRAAVTELLGGLDEQETNCRHATISQVRACPTCAAVVEGYVKLISLAAQPQGERGKALLAVVEAARAWKDLHEAYIPSLLDPPLAAAQKHLFKAIAAIDGEQPKRCHAGGDGDCDWAECPQKANYQQWCPLARHADGAQPS